MSIAALVRRLSELGASAEMIATAVDAVEEVEAKDAERRAKRAAQKAKERETKAVVARQSRDNAATVADLSPESPAPFPPKDNIKPPLSPSPIEILREALSESTAKDLLAHRKAKKSPLTAGSAKGLVRAFVAFGDPEAAALEMMAQGWTGFKPEYMRSIQPRAAPPRADPQEIRNPALRALQRLSQKNAQRTDEPDIFSARSGPGQCAPSGGNPAPETGDAPGRFGPVLNLAAYR